MKLNGDFDVDNADTNSGFTQGGRREGPITMTTMLMKTFILSNSTKLTSHVLY